ncbi:nucleotidyltransferase-like protein [Paenibacillus sp. y28]|uniref:nucleotidyltransferase-like protein n=1 Tax=Paenibacillus sp. y28 TaxID=3129110 RepID=UPI0030189761
MERLIQQQLLQHYESNPAVISVSAVSNPTRFSPLTDAFDLLLLIVTDQSEQSHSLYHYIKDGYRIQERWIGTNDLESGLLTGDNRRLIQWILKGDIVLDRGLFMERLRHKLLEFPIELRERKLFAEFNHFLHSYLQAKQYLQEEQTLDAYSSTLEALHHWARIVIIEEGYHPELSVWAHVKRVNPGVYKLYEELTLSTETLAQRVELVLLACEFSVMSKMESCCSLLVRLLEKREEPWTVEDLQCEPDLALTHADLSLLLNKLVRKSLIKEVAVMGDADLTHLELKYTKI